MAPYDDGDYLDIGGTFLHFIRVSKALSARRFGL